MVKPHVIAMLTSAALGLPALFMPGLAPVPHTPAVNGQNSTLTRIASPPSPSTPSAVASERISGDNRYATAAAVAARWSGGVDVVYVTGATPQESLLASAQAASHAAPLLYTRPTSVPGVTMQALADLAPAEIVVIGSISTVSDAVLVRLGEIAPTTRAWSGDLYRTAASLTRPAVYGPNAPSAGWDRMDTAYLVSPSSQDAYSTPAVAAVVDADVLLTPPTELHPATATLLRRHRPRDLVVVGGTASISDAVARAAATEAGLADFTRIAGADQFETSALLADSLPSWSSGVIGNGKGPIDALAAGPLAAQYDAPLLLTMRNSAPAAALNVVESRSPNALTVVGGPGAVSQPTFDAFIQAADGAPAEPPPDLPSPPEDPVWGEPAWNDEFDGSSVDTSRWTVRDGTYVGYDWAIITDDAVSVQDGMLRIRMEEMPDPVIKGDGRERYWTTGYLDSIGHHEAQYGRWEIRAKVPTLEGETRGVWPAFWLRNADEGEIDIMEAWGGPEIRHRRPSLHNTSRFTVHESTNHTGDSKGWEYEHQLWPGEHPYDTPTEFHEWAVEYTPTYLKAYLDDELAIHITPDKEHISGVIQDFSWAWGPNFESPWNMRLNMQMGNDYGTPGLAPSPYSVMPADYLVDYVRFYDYSG